MRVAIIGTGLIGGSLGLALHRVNDVERIAGHDRNPAASAKALEIGAIDETAATAAAACAGADVIFVATPVNSIVASVADALPGFAPGAILTDVGSTKARVSVEVRALLASSPAVSFVGGHPMAGSEQDGIEAARADVFEGAWWVLTPDETTDPKVFQALHRLLSKIGARLMSLEPQRHDELMAVISHLPQLTATSIMNLAAEKGREHGGLLALAAGGFRDVTRIAASNPDLWVDICLENKEALGKEIVELSTRLKTIEGYLRDGDADALRNELVTAREARRSLGKKELPGDLYEIALEIPDRPGVLADVTRLVGEQGINIEDLAITHAAEGGRGSLRLAILGGDESTRVQALLSSHGYITTRLQL